MRCREALFFAFGILTSFPAWAADDPELPRAAYRIEVKVSLIGNFGLQGDGVEIFRPSGSAVMVSPDGFLLTNAHIVRPESLVRSMMRKFFPFCRRVSETVRFDRPTLRRVDRVHIGYSVESIDGAIYLADYEFALDIFWHESDGKCPPRLFWKSLETRRIDDTGRSLAIVGFDLENDLALLKVNTGHRLPHATLPRTSPVLTVGKSAVGQDVYLLATGRENGALAIFQPSGRVSGYRTEKPPLPPQNIELALAIRFGFSGSGVFAPGSSELLGIVWGGQALGPVHPGARLEPSYMIPGAVVRKFFERARYEWLRRMAGRVMRESP